MNIEVVAVDPARWPDLETLFGQDGAYRGCWCMFWRRTSKDFSAASPARRKSDLRRTVGSGAPVGLLGYLDGEPAGWCGVAPRPDFPRVLRSPHFRPEDPQEPAVWSVTCFFVRADRRGSGVALALLDGAVEHARAQGASVLEGYPVDVESKGRRGDLSSGTTDLFTRADFTVYRRPADGRRLVMRRQLRPATD